MRESQITRRPEYFTGFQCTGSECPETCCRDWYISIDKLTYQKYKRLKAAGVSEKVSRYVMRNENGCRSEEDFAHFELMPDQKCGFLNEKGLCSLQLRYGEGYLSHTCAQYPRLYSVIDGCLEMSATMSCYVICEKALLNPAPMVFVEETLKNGNQNVEHIGIDVLDTKAEELINHPIRYLSELRAACIGLLQAREYLFEERLFAVGWLTASADELVSEGKLENIPQLIEECLMHAEEGSFMGELDRTFRDSSVRVKMALNILDKARKELGYIGESIESRHISEFFQGLGIGDEPDVENGELILKLADYDERYFTPYLREKEYVFENMLVHNMFTNKFPFQNHELSMYENYIALMSHYAILKTVISAAAQRAGTINDELVLKLIYSFARLQEHNCEYDATILSIAANKKIYELPQMIQMFRD